ncbi:MAG TPA: hypothetical protein VJC14_00030 [Candidatus Paceibacterota bacterium]
MKSKFHKFKKMPLFLSIIFLLFSATVLFLLYRQIENNTLDSKQAQVAWQDEFNRRSQLQSLERSLRSVETERALLESHFIKSSDIVPFLEMIEKSAPSVGATAEVSLVDIPKDNSGLLVEMKVNGRFESVYKFLTLLENSSYELDFLYIDIQQSSSGDIKDSSSQWLATFRVKLLSFVAG